MILLADCGANGSACWRGAGWAVYGPALFFSGQLLPTSLAILLDLAALTLLVQGLARPAWWRWLAAGVVTGLATITVPNALVLAGAGVIVLGWRAWRSPDRGQPARAAVAGGLLLVGTALPVSAVAARNYARSGEFVLIANSGGINLYLGNNPDREQTLAIRPGARWYQLYRTSSAGGATSPAQRNSYFLHEALGYMRTDPGGFVRGLAHKTHQLVAARELPRTFDPYTYREFSTLLSVLLGRAGPIAGPFGVLAPLAALGVVTSMWHRRRRAAEAPVETLPQAVPGGRVLLLLFVGLYAATVVLFFVSARHRLPVCAGLMPFAAAGVVSAVDALRRRRAGGWATVGAVAVVVVVVVAVNRPVTCATDGFPFRAELDASLADKLAAQRQVDVAERLARRAVTRAPTYAAGWARLGLVLVQQGRVGEAEASFRKAVELEPATAEYHWYVAQALVEQQRPSEAWPAVEEASRLDPYAPAALALRGDLYRQSGRPAEAAADYQRVLQYHPERVEVWYDLARAWREAGECGLALSAYEAGFARAQPQPIDLLNTAELYLSCSEPGRRDAERARALARQLAEATQYSEPRALYVLAHACAEAGPSGEVLPLLARAQQAAEQQGDAALAQRIADQAASFARTARWDDAPAAATGTPDAVGPTDPRAGVSRP